MWTFLPLTQVRALTAVPCCPHAGNRGLLPAAHAHGVAHSDVETGVLREPRVGLYADAEDDEVRVDCALVGDDALRLERSRSLAETHVDPVPPQGGSDEGSHVRVEGAHHLRSRLEQRDLRAAMRERLGHLEPDVAPAHDDDVLQRFGTDVVEQVLRVVEGLHTVHVVVVDAGEVGTDRNASGRDQRLVEPEAEGAVLLDRADLDLARVDIEPDDLVAHPDVDAEPIAELLRRPCDEIAELRDLSTHEVRDAARRVRRVVAALERDDLHVGSRAAHLRHRGHPARISPDDHQAFGHPAQDRGANMW